MRIRAYDFYKYDSASNSGDSKPPNGTPSKTRREILLEYVKNVQPEFMELFVKRAPQQVVDAMRQTVTNMIGTLPSQFFAVTVTAVAENLAQLMYSVMMTGYMFKNAQNRLELQQSLEQVALPDVQDKKDLPDYAPATQKNLSGEVIRWNNVSGPEKIDAKKYIELLEAEIEELNHQVGRKSANGQNELLEYLKSLEPQNLKELTSSAGEDVMLAMNTFIKRLLAVANPEEMKTSITETSAPELAKLLYWLMVVGYSIRNIEVRFDMDRFCVPHGLKQQKAYCRDELPQSRPIDQSEISARLQRLKQSLSEALTFFYLFAGKVKNELYIDCNDDGVSYTRPRYNVGYMAFLDKIWQGFMKRFVFDASAVATLKARAASSTFVQHPTRVEAVSAFIWQCTILASKARHGSQRPSVLSHIVNLRGKKSTHLPEYSVGNLLWMSIAKCSAEAERELPLLVGVLRESILQIDGNFVQKLSGEEGFSKVCECLREFGEVYSNAGTDYLTCSSLCKVGIYETDFGWGKPIWVSPGGINGPVFQNLFF
ncbi:hypothetical protein GH714_007238 [Hevea brasiliensis]|uniref:Uncharacterized protein n=1 Tax=Hevea brasiliensis TaxID=3981 RepID=A0A6A6MAB8_HEVBR|nr:hypothetical protein GH714_007238 [Hevea brasiliensis]